MFNAKIVQKVGNGVRGAVYFKAESSSEITPEKACEAQAKLGYIPQGYGFESFKTHWDAVLLRYTATWKCQASCD
jgi:hypothetical protein